MGHILCHLGAACPGPFSAAGSGDYQSEDWLRRKRLNQPEIRCLSLTSPGRDAGPQHPVPRLCRAAACTATSRGAPQKPQFPAPEDAAAFALQCWWLWVPVLLCRARSSGRDEIVLAPVIIHLLLPPRSSGALPSMAMSRAARKTCFMSAA